MVDLVSTGERIAKLGLGVAKLVIGGERVDTAKEVFGLIADGRKLHADLTSEAEKALATRLAKAADEKIAYLAKTHEWTPASLKTAELHLHQALSVCRPDDAVFAESGLKPGAIVDQMRLTVVAKGGELGDAYRDDTPSRKLFEQTVTQVIADLTNSAEFIEEIAPSLWKTVLGSLDRLEDRSERIEALTVETQEYIHKLSQTEQIAERALRAIFQAFHEDRPDDAVLMSVQEIARAVLPEVKRFKEQRAHLLAPTGGDPEENARRRRAAELMDEGQFAKARELLASVSESRLQRAQEAANAAAQLLADASDALSEEAQAAWLAGDIDKAIDLLDQAIKLTDADAQVTKRRMRELGVLYRTVGQVVGRTDMVHGGLNILLDIETAFDGAERADVSEEIAHAALAMSDLDNAVDWLSIIQPSVKDLVFYRFASEDEEAIAKTCLLQSHVYLGLAKQSGRSDFLNMAGNGFHGVTKMAEKLGDRDLYLQAYSGVAATQQLEGSADMLRNAIQTYESIIELLDENQDRARVAGVKLDLASTLSALHSRIDDRAEQTSLLQRSEHIYTELEAAHPKSEAPYFWSQVHLNFAGVRIAQAALERNSDKANEAERICEDVIAFAKDRNLSRIAEMAEIRRNDAREFAARLSLAAS